MLFEMANSAFSPGFGLALRMLDAQRAAMEECRRLNQAQIERWHREARLPWAAGWFDGWTETAREMV